MKKDYTFQKVLETRKGIKDKDDLIWLESTELTIDKRKFLLNGLFLKQTNHKTMLYCVLLTIQMYLKPESILYWSLFLS